MSSDRTEHRALIEPDHVVVARLDLRIRNTGGVFLLGWRDTILEMADVAAFLWRMVDGRRTVGDIAALIAAEYDAELSEVMEDVETIVSGLVEAQFVRLVPKDEQVRYWY